MNFAANSSFTPQIDSKRAVKAIDCLTNDIDIKILIAVNAGRQSSAELSAFTGLRHDELMMRIFELEKIGFVHVKPSGELSYSITPRNEAVRRLLAYIVAD